MGIKKDLIGLLGLGLQIRLKGFWAKIRFWALRVLAIGLSGLRISFGFGMAMKGFGPLGF